MYSAKISRTKASAVEKIDSELYIAYRLQEILSVLVVNQRGVLWAGGVRPPAAGASGFGQY